MTEKFRSLEGASESNKRDQGFERRRVPRLALTSEQFRLAQNGRIFSIADLSDTGMAIRIIDREDLNLFPVGQEFEGVINIKRNKYDVNAQVMHIGKDLVGCRFKAISDETRRAISAFLDPAELGKDLKPIPAADGIALWYHGPSGTDLLFWRNPDGQYSKLILFFLGTFVQWDADAGVSTGRLASSFEQSEMRGVIRLETMLLTHDPDADAGKLGIARTLISSSRIPEDLRHWCERQLG